MWCYSQRGIVPFIRVTAAACFLAMLGGCTVEPLNSSRPDSKLSSYSPSDTTRAILASTSVNPVTSRVGQQVRNNLLFSLNGGQLQSGGQYSVNLTVKSLTTTLSIENSSLAPTSAKVQVTVDYQLIDKRNGKMVSNGKRRAFAGFDRTPQSFANERAERDAENRAAKQVAQQVRLALSQSIAGL